MNPLQNFASLKYMLRRRALLMIFAIFCGTALAALFAASREPTYEASAVIQIETPQVAAAIPGGTALTSNSRNRLQLIEQKLLSRDSILAVIDKFGLYAKFPELTDLEKVDLLRQSVDIWEIQDPAQAWRADSQPSGLRINVWMSDPRNAADVANEFLSLALLEGKSRSETRAQNTLAFFENEEKRVSQEMAAMEQEFARFKERNDGSLPEHIPNQREQLAQLRTSQLDVETQVVQLETNTARLRAEERERQSDLLQQQLVLIGNRISAIEAKLAAAPEVERIYSMMQREMNQLQEQYRTVTARLTDATMAQQLESQDQSERFEVLETAVVPTEASSAGAAKIVVAGAIASTMGAIGLAFLLELLSPVMRNSARVEKELGIVPVVVIPVLKKPRLGFGRRFALAISTGIFFALDLPLMLKDKFIGGV